MQPEVVVGLASAGVGALAIAASTFTNIRSLSVQRENASATVETQRFLADAQERALRDRSDEEVLREHRAVLYSQVVRWVYDVLAALDELSETSLAIPRAVWHIKRSVEDEIDLYSSDAIHIRFTSLRALLIGLVEDSTFDYSPIVTWDEDGGRVSNVEVEQSPALAAWPERSRLRDDAHESALDLVSTIRGEVRGRRHSGFFVTYRLGR